MSETLRVRDCNNPDCDARFDTAKCPSCGWIHPTLLAEAFRKASEPDAMQRSLEDALKVEALLERDAAGNVQCPFCRIWMAGVMVKHTEKGPALYCLNADCPSHRAAS